MRSLRGQDLDNNSGVSWFTSSNSERESVLGKELENLQCAQVDCSRSLSEIYMEAFADTPIKLAGMTPAGIRLQHRRIWFFIRNGVLLKQKARCEKFTAAR